MVTSWRGSPIAVTRERAVAAVAFGSDLNALLDAPADAGAARVDIQAVAAALQIGSDPQRLVQSLVTWVPEAEGKVADGDVSALPIWIAGVVLLADLARQAPQSPLAQYAIALLARARGKTSQWELGGARAWLDVALSTFALSQKDLHTARSYAVAAHQGALQSAASGAPHDVLAPADDQILPLLGTVARALYDANAPAPAADVARLALSRQADDEAALHTLGVALLKLEQWEEAVNVWLRFAERVPDVSAGYANQAVALSRLGRFEEAISVQTRAIELVPAAPRPLLNRGIFKVQAKDSAGAVDDFRRGYELAASSAGDERGNDRVERGTAAQDKVLALSLLLDALEATGGTAEVRGEIERLKGSDDVRLREAAHFLGARLAAAMGDEDAVLAELGAAVALDPENAEARASRIRAQLARGDIAAAAEDLRFLGARERQPELVVELLDDWLQRHPGDLLARKWRGYANQQRQHAIAAKPDLVAALQGMPDDVELQYWDALADLTLVPVDMELTSLDDVHLDKRKVFSALSRLALLIGRTHDGEQLRVYRWFIDRLAMDWEFVGVLHAAGHQAGGWYSVSPRVEKAVLDIERAFALNDERRWVEAADLFEGAAATFAEEEYPCLAARTALYVADTRIRTYELDRAREAFTAAERMSYLVGQHLSKVFDRVHQDDRTADRESVNIELEYFPIYGLGFSEFDVRRRGLKADLLHRLGATDQAIETLGDLDEFLQAAEAFGQFRLLFTAFVILRDAGRYEEAERTAMAAEKLATDPMARGTLANGRAVMAMLRRDYPAAELAVRQALEILGETETSGEPALRLTLAQCLFWQGKVEETRRIMQSLDETPLRSPYEELGRAFFNAMVHTALDNHEEAARLFGFALERIDQLRERLNLRDRMTWQQRFSEYFAFGAARAVQAGDATAALDLVEQSRGRALLDEVESDASVSPELAHLLERRDVNERRRFALEEIVTRGESAAHDYALLHTASSDDRSRSRLVSDEGVLDLGAARTMLDDVRASLSVIEERIAQAEADRARFRGARAATFQDIRAMLAAAERPVVFVTYLTTSSTTYIFFSRADSDEPEVATVDVSAAHLADAAAEWTKAIRAADPAPETPAALRTLIEPLFSRASDGTTLWIVPPTVAYQVPFHALDVEGVRLIDKFPIVYAPTASMMRACRSVPARPIARALVVGDPLGDLPFAREEALMIAASTGTEPLLGSAATRENVEEATRAGSLDLMHFAAHGWFDDSSPMKSGIVLAAPLGATAPEEILRADDLRRMDLAADMIVVSGCETGRSRVGAGEEMMGLARGILVAGTRSLVVSLWNVADISTTFFMRRFYLRLAEGIARAEAIRDAQLWLQTLTVDDVVEDLERMSAEAAAVGDQRRYIILRTACASILASAGRQAAALATCEEVLARLDEQGQSRMLKAITALADRIRRREHHRADQTHPFRAPFYWAPFILSGSWD